MKIPEPKLKPDEPGCCEHCGALIYGDSARCPQCDRFPIKLRHCPECGCIAAREADRCWKCGRIFEPGGDYL